MSIRVLLIGFLIGLGKIIPGVSGSVLAILFGVYERIIENISSPKKLVEDYKFMLTIGMGILIAILLGSKFIYYFLINYYLYTMSIFIGMMLPGAISLFKYIDNRDVTYKRVLSSILIFFSLVLLSIIKFESDVVNINRSIFKFMSLILCGLIDALSTVIPGISGSALLMIMGYYNLIISSLGNPLKWESIKVLLPFLIGLIIGLYLVSKLITYLFKHYKSLTYMLIISLSTFSIFTLIKNVMFQIDSFKLGIVSISFIVLGFLLARMLDNLVK